MKSRKIVEIVNLSMISPNTRVTPEKTIKG
jgi:hypothetical protein